MHHPRLLLIVNPIAGSGRKKKNLAAKIVKRLVKMGYEVDLQYTQSKGDATRIANEAVKAGSLYHGVLACGGDGTVNETARALCGTNLALGIIPAGSGNGLARHVGIPVDPMLALGVIKSENIIDCDYCTANGNKFFCTFGVGFDAAVSQRFAKKAKRGLVNYLRSAMEEFVHYHHRTYTIKIGDQTFTDQAFLVTVANASQYGNNAYIAPGASIVDGLLDVVIVHKANPVRTALLGVDLLMGMIKHNTLIDTFQTPSVTIHRQDCEGSVHIDGEPIEMEQEIEILCHSRQLRMFVPRHDSRFIPILTPVYNTVKDAGVRIYHFFENL